MCLDLDNKPMEGIGKSIFFVTSYSKACYGHVVYRIVVTSCSERPARELVQHTEFNLDIYYVHRITDVVALTEYLEKLHRHKNKQHYLLSKTSNSHELLFFILVVKCHD